MTGERSSLEIDRDRMLRMGTEALRAAGTFDHDPASRAPAPPAGLLVDRLLAAPPADAGELAPLLGLVVDAAAASADTSGPRCFSHVPGSAPFAAVLGAMLGAAVNRHTAYAISSPPLVAMEQGLVRWLAGLAGLPRGAGGLLTSGGSLSTLTALAAARTALPEERSHSAAVYLTASTHGCIAKSLAVLGVRPERVRTVPEDRAGRMDAAALAAAITRDRRAGLNPWLIVATAGTTDRGSVDPLPALGRIARREGTWLHVDAAYGGAYLLTDRGRSAMEGIEAADSVVIDAHKGLFTPFGLGAVLVRDEETLRRAFRSRGAYLRDQTSYPGLSDAADLGLELSRGPRALPLWLPLWLHGTDAYTAALNEKLDLAEHAARRLSDAATLEVRPPQLTTLLLRLRGSDDTAQQQLLDAAHARGQGTLSSTVVDGKVWLRVCVQSLHTHAEHVDDLVDAVLAAAGRLGARVPAARRSQRREMTAAQPGACATPGAAGAAAGARR
jgi:aromatic-L-amino-acid decarboxylase